MPSDRDLEQQLRAFGATLADRAGEPIGPAMGPMAPVAPTPAGGSRRRWVLVGAAACVVALVAGLFAVARGGGGAVTPGGADSDGLGPLGSLRGVGVVIEGTVIEHRGSRATLSAFGGVDYEGRSENADDWTTPFGLPVIVLDDAEVVRAIGGSDAADALAADAEAQVAAGTAIEVLAPVGVYEIGERYQLWLQPSRNFGFMAHLAFDDDGRPVDGLGAPGLDEAIAALTEHTGGSVLDSLAALAREMNVRSSGGEQGPMMDFVFGPEQPESSGPADTITASAEMEDARPLTVEFRVPDDPVGLTADGWVSGGVRSVLEYGVVDTTSCQEAKELEALGGGFVAWEVYERPGDDLPWVQITSVSFTDAAAAWAAVGPMTDLADCEQPIAGQGTPAPIDFGGSDGSAAAAGYALDDRSLVVAVADDGRVMIIDVANVADPDLPGRLGEAAIEHLSNGEPWQALVPVPARDATAEEMAVLDGDDRGLVCDSNGIGAAEWDYGEISDADPRGRRPVDAFRDALAELAQDALRDGGRALPSTGWIELVASDSQSYFVLEVDGAREAVVSVSGDPALGVWRHGSADLCQSLFLPEGYVPPTTVPVVTSAPPPPQPPVTTAPLDGTIPGQVNLTVEPHRPGDPFPSIAPDDQVLVLMVSNQSFEDDPIALWMGIDGIQFAADRYVVGSQHTVTTYLVRGLPAGRHELTVETDTGVSHTARITVNDGAPRWAYVTYWYYPDDGKGRYVNVLESDEPIAID
jgi:hypothetical protein